MLFGSLFLRPSFFHRGWVEAVTTNPASAAAHPSPHKNEVGIVGLLYGLMAAPIAWVSSQIASSIVAQEACFPKTESLSDPAFAVAGLHIGLLSVAFAVSASAAGVAYANWRRTKRESGGNGHTLLDVGEGRSRFMALAGLLTSFGFMLGTLFSIPAVVFVPAC